MIASDLLLYYFHTEDCFTSFSLNMLHSVHWGINPPQKYHPPLSCQAPPPLNRETVQAPPFFRQSPLLYWFFVKPPLKVRSFGEPPKY